jgi:DNA-binding NarL/FixJ family response regulator
MGDRLMTRSDRPEQQSISVLLCCYEHRMYHFRDLLEEAPDFEILANTHIIYDALDLAGQIDPDLVIVNPLHIVARIANAFPHARILVYSLGLDRDVAEEALANGATGCIFEPLYEYGDELREKIRQVASGQQVIELGR